MSTGSRPQHLTLASYKAMSDEQKEDLARRRLGQLKHSDDTPFNRQQMIEAYEKIVELPDDYYDKAAQHDES